MGRTRKLEPNALSRLAADLRERAGLSLVKLSEHAGRSRWALRDYEQGAYQTPIEYVALLAQVLAQQEATNGRIAPGDADALLHEVNAAITACHGRRRAFAAWDQLVAAAEQWRATRQPLEETLDEEADSFDLVRLPASLPTSAPASPPLPPPRSQLRGATPDFVGRTAEIARLTQALTASAQTGVVVSR
jgi:hypothetical protein